MLTYQPPMYCLCLGTVISKSKTCHFFVKKIVFCLQKNAELPECARYRQFVRDLNPCAREKLLMCGGAVFDPNVRDLVILGFIK